MKAVVGRILCVWMMRIFVVDKFQFFLFFFVTLGTAVVLAATASRVGHQIADAWVALPV